ncbi:hypothetical protein ACWGIU_18055 [Streptomyces sp. NPDC054840]
MNASRLRKVSPLIYPAAALSLASLAWTTWSLVDLLGTGLIGATVAAGADVIWASVILAEARRLRLGGKAWAVPLVGWAALVAVAGLLAWHGIERDVIAMAVAGPLLPVGAKIVWAFALADMRDPAALTEDEQHTLAAMERGMAFEEAKHRIAMRRREMGAELQMSEVSTDFDIEIMRQDKARELHRRRPLELTAGAASSPRTSSTDEGENFALIGSEISHPDEANVAGRSPVHGEVFGFAAALTGREISRPSQAKTSPPRRARISPTKKAKAGAKPDPRKAAVAEYLESKEDGQPLTGAELGRRHGRTARWGQMLIAEIDN